MPLESEAAYREELYRLCEAYIQARVELDRKLQELAARYEEARLCALNKRLAADAAEAEEGESANCDHLRANEQVLRDALIAALYRYEEALSQQTVAERELSDLLSQIAILEAHIEHLQAELVFLESRVEVLQDMLAPDTSDPELERVRELITSIQEDIETHRQELANLNGRVETAQAAVDEKNRATDGAEAELTQAENAYEANNDELDRCEDLEGEATGDVEKLREEQRECERMAEQLTRNAGTIWVDEITAARDEANAILDDYLDLRAAAALHAEEDNWDLPEPCQAPLDLDY